MAIKKPLYIPILEKNKEESDVGKPENVERTDKVFTAFLRMTYIERLTIQEYYRTDPKITTSASVANDLIMKNKKSFAKEMNPKLLTSDLLKSMYHMD